MGENIRHSLLVWNNKHTQKNTARTFEFEMIPLIISLNESGSDSSLCSFICSHAYYQAPCLHIFIVTIEQTFFSSNHSILPEIDLFLYLYTSKVYYYSKKLLFPLRGKLNYPMQGVSEADYQFWLLLTTVEPDAVKHLKKIFHSIA
jgi:hypothetical protein